MNFDLFLFQKINALATKYLWLDILGVYFANYFGYFLILFLFLFLVNFKKYFLMILEIIGGVIFSRLIIVELIRLIFPRTRPFVENNVNLLLSHSLTPAFPSGHSAFYFALATVIYFYLKNLKKRPKFWRGVVFLFFGGAFLISISRVFSGVHWPSDILAGALVGIFSGWFISYFFQRCFLISLNDYFNQRKKSRID